ncbi:TATA box-binding protein-associated factor RNA polymerase I subunit A [Ornithorhynchus anatinus]|uniref:TATA-box binding protein associated factor, RNA polymerase I subunit A n=1 Tax=Ornithorhynchus anatinus TaxID=9258 RepID=F7GDT0_ORNAN|nr:TATA box-binding protein-associated factor RNA polymerase I subunit A [Ornithorhynchus anatinus]XP_028903482.1 TATA box-binding protein-associated factor RNA polymerase I subunit A [Ornithorhynchus anatinus]
MDSFSEEFMKSMTGKVQGETSTKSHVGICLPTVPKQLENAVNEGQKKDFALSTNTCLNYIQEAILKHQWQKAAEFMQYYFQTLEDTTSSQRQVAPEIIWKLGSEILYHHPESSIEIFSTFADRMKNIGIRNYLKISLQHAFYLMCNGMIEDAHRNLTLAESWRYGEKSSSQEKLIKLIQAYRGLLDYYTWSKKRVTLSTLDGKHFTSDAVTQDMHSYFRLSSLNLHEIIKIPGIWDPFVKSYVEMLEFYEDNDGAQQVLTNYAYDDKFPCNPNAHVYLYEFLKRQQAPEEKLISVLKILHQIVPSHKLMLEFHTLLRKSKKEEHHKLGLEVIFGVLDYAGCTENVIAWKFLARHLKQTLKRKHLDWVEEEWNARKDWWPTFHFSYFLVKRNWKKNKTLAYKKAFVAGLLLGKGCKYFTYISNRGGKAEMKVKKMKKLVQQHSIVNTAGP